MAYHSGIEALRLVAHTGRIGEIQGLCTTRHAWVEDFHGGDVFWTRAVHDLTIIKHILGYIPDKIKSIHVIKNEDLLPVSFTAMLDDTPMVSMSVSGRHCNKISGVSIHGKRSAYYWHDCLVDHSLMQETINGEKIAIDVTFPLYLELKEFVEYLSNGPKPRCNLQSAKEVTEAILNLRKKGNLKK